MVQQRGSVHTVVIIGLVVALIGALSVIFWQNFLSKTPETEESTTAKQEPVDTPLLAKGTVAGKAIYPSEAYPPDYKVCLLDATSQQEVACDTTIEQNAYSLEVTPGRYLVVAKTGGMLGYYDGYMKSDMTADLCDTANNTPIAITVEAGATVSHIDAGNFYYDPKKC